MKAITLKLLPTSVYVTFDTLFETWNVMTLKNDCVFYSEKDNDIDDWLDHHENYKENEG